jgi:hypothetical protein
MIKHHQSCSQMRSRREQSLGLKPHEAKRRAVKGNRELKAASLRVKAKASLSEKVKPATRGARSDEGLRVLPGVRADSASRKIQRELGISRVQPVQVGRASGRELIRGRAACGKSEGFVVARNRPTPGEQRNPGHKEWSQKSAWTDWHEMPRTKEADGTRSRGPGKEPEMRGQTWNLCCAETETEGKGQAGNCACLARILWRKPDAGNPLVRFDEGEGDIADLYLLSVFGVPSLLYYNF